MFGTVVHIVSRCEGGKHIIKVHTHKDKKAHKHQTPHYFYFIAMVQISATNIHRARKWRLSLPLLLEFACFLCTSISIACTGLTLLVSCMSSIGTHFDFSRNSVEEWCSTAECQERLKNLRTKLELEDELFQDQLNQATAPPGTECQRDENQDWECPPSSIRSSHAVNKERFRKEDILRERRHELLEGGAVESRPEYRPKPEWRVNADGDYGSFPSLNVVGQIKTGTSHLYNIFTTHQDVMTIPGDEKEHCASDHFGSETPDQDLWEYGMFRWHDYYYRHKPLAVQQQQQNHHQVNGCLVIDDLERRYAYNPPATNTKFFFLLRDPADWAWAAYNFFCDESSELFEPDENWVNETLHYRSPEAFHELVLSGGKLKGSELLTELRDDSVRNLRRLRALVGDDNLIVLKNEDMQPHRIHQDNGDGRGSTLGYLASRAGLSVEGFNKTVLESRSNCNANKGYDAKCQEDGDRSKGVGYPVTKGRPMLESTRKFLYVQWYETCTIWAQEFGVVYPNCLSALGNMG